MNKKQLPKLQFTHPHTRHPAFGTREDVNPKTGEVKTSVLAAILVVVILVCAVSVFRQCGTEEGTFDVQNFGGFGGYAANQVMEHLGSGRKVVVITFNESGAILFGRDHYAFMDTLKGNGYKVKAIEVGPGAL